MKKTFILLFIAFLIFLTLFATTVCTEGGGSSGGGSSGGSGDDDDDETPATLYAIGDIGPSGVGIVFYITDGGLHGLEAAPSDQSASQAWITGGSTQTTLNGNTSTDIGTGLANSNAIIAQVGHTASAAQVCRSYTGGGLTDWFLPSKDELNQLYLQKNTVGGFASEGYWSSSEYNSSFAWGHSFNNGTQYGNRKNLNNHRVRAVRAF